MSELLNGGDCMYGSGNTTLRTRESLMLDLDDCHREIEDLKAGNIRMVEGYQEKIEQLQARVDELVTGILDYAKIVLPAPPKEDV